VADAGDYSNFIDLYAGEQGIGRPMLRAEINHHAHQKSEQPSRPDHGGGGCVSSSGTCGRVGRVYGSGTRIGKGGSGVQKRDAAH
jgi:hypothetical protein